jgi:hypothetical protein
MSFIEDIDNEMNARSVAYGEKAIRFIDEAIVDLSVNNGFDESGIRVLAPKWIVDGINDYFSSLPFQNLTSRAIVGDENGQNKSWLKYKGFSIEVGYERDAVVFHEHYPVCDDPDLIRRKLIEI